MHGRRVSWEIDSDISFAKHDKMIEICVRSDAAQNQSWTWSYNLWKKVSLQKKSTFLQFFHKRDEPRYSNCHQCILNQISHVLMYNTWYVASVVVLQDRKTWRHIIWIGVIYNWNALQKYSIKKWFLIVRCKKISFMIFFPTQTCFWCYTKYLQKVWDVSDFHVEC